MNASIRLRALVLPLALALVFLLLLAQRVDAGDTTLPTESHRVVAGDTLWDLADERTEPGSDVRSVVRLIQRLNDLDGAVACMERLIDQDRQSAIGHYNLGCYLALRGEADRAIDELSIGCGIDSSFRAQLATESDLESLRDDPRFLELLPKTNDRPHRP